MTDVTDFFNTTHTIEQCTTADIDGHYELIAQHIFNKRDQKQGMKECIEAGTAFKIGNDCFLYYVNDTKNVADGFGIYGDTVPQNLLALIVGVFTKIDTETFCLRMEPFKPGWETNYRSLLTRASLRNRNDKNYPYIIRIDELLKHYKRFINK